MTRALTLGVTLACAGPGGPVSAQTRTLGIIGDSISQATHSDDDCEGDDIIRCLKERLLKADQPFSFVSSEQPYSVRTALGISSGQEGIINRSKNGARWDDALEQAQSIVRIAGLRNTEVDAVFILLGGNDVCRGHGETPSELPRIQAHIDATLTYLTDQLPAGSTVYLADIPDIVPLRNLMKDYTGNLVFESCQGTWDLNVRRIGDDAIEDSCDALAGSICSGFGSSPFLSAGRKLIEETLETTLGDNSTTLGGSCGNILSSASTPAERAFATTYNADLVTLIKSRASAFDERNGVNVLFIAGLYEVELQRSDLSKLDCFHPSRAGQARIGAILGEALGRLGAELARRPPRRLVPVLELLLDDAPAPAAPAN